MQNFDKFNFFVSENRRPWKQLLFHTVRNLHFLSKNSILISRENCRFFWGWKTRENVVVLDFLAVDNFDFTRKIVKKNFGEKLVKMLGFCQNWIFGQKFDFSNSVLGSVFSYCRNDRLVTKVTCELAIRIPKKPPGGTMMIPCDNYYKQKNSQFIVPVLFDCSIFEKKLQANKKAFSRWT